MRPAVPAGALGPFRFVDGPLAGQTYQMDRIVKRYSVGRFWTYTLAGSEGGVRLMAREPKSREGRRLLARHDRTRKDPRLLASAWKTTPVRGTTDKRGQGRRRRAKGAA